MANAPDVRVRLSAEGTAEVVNAFKRIQAEAQRTAQQSKLAGEGHAFLNKQLASMKELLPALAAGAIVAGFAELAKSGLELADNLGKLHQKTGLASETLSTFSFAARFADVEQESLAKGLVKFTKSMDDYDKGAGKARGAIENLFGNESALKGLNMDQRLQKIVEKLGSLEPGAKRTGAAVALFGKAGAELLPVMDELGAQGFDAVAKKAQKLGLAFNEDAIAAAENLKRAMITLKAEGQGMATQFLLGLAPQLANAVDAITDATSEGAVNGFEKAGKYTGYIVNGIVAAFLVVGKTIGFVFSEGVELWSHFGEYVSNMLKGTWDLVKGYVRGGAAGVALELAFAKPGENTFLDRLKAYMLDAEKSVSDLFKEKPAPKKKKGDGSVSAEDDGGKAAKVALDLAQAQADARLKVETALQKRQEAAERERYDKGLESLREYYGNRLAIVQEQSRKEADAAYGKVLALENAPLGKGEMQDERQAKIAAARADWQVKVIEGEQQLATLRADEAKEAEALQQKALDFEKKVEKAQGDRFAAAKAAIDAEAAQLDEILRKQGVATGERAQRVGDFRTAGYAQVDFSKLEAQGRAAMDALDAERQKINQGVQGGLLFEFEGEQQKMALEQQRLPILRQIADEMKRAAITPEQIQAARDFAAQVDQLAVSSNKAALQMAQFKQGVEQALTADLSNWLSSGIDQAENLGDAFRGLALSVVQSLRQIASQMLATYMIQKMLGFLGMAAGGASGAGAGAGGGGGAAFADGGLVRGAGTGTSDSIAARLSNGEYVVRTAAVRQPGVLEMLNTLNYGTPSVRRRGGTRFADGGLVDAQAAGGQDAHLTATLALDEGLLLKRLEASPAFHRLHVRVTQQNAKAIKQSLRG